MDVKKVLFDERVCVERAVGAITESRTDERRLLH